MVTVLASSIANINYKRQRFVRTLLLCIIRRFLAQSLSVAHFSLSFASILHPIIIWNAENLATFSVALNELYT